MKRRFTGATAQKKGKFELADGGTLFLDEIGELAPDAGKLLRVLQDKEFQRVGGVRDIRVDVHILAATNRDLHQAMQRGTVRISTTGSMWWRSPSLPSVNGVPISPLRPSLHRALQSRGEPARAEYHPGGGGHAASLSLARQCTRVAKCH